MERQGVSIEYLKVCDSYTTAESYVLLQDDGERSIIMATGSTSEINAEAAMEHFSEAVAKARIFTTEISQVRLVVCRARSR
jgi:sugar/nucleoside kinase (ribokinase family)